LKIEKIRDRISVNGIVQGVGFRPFIYNLAQNMGLNGFIRNGSRGVEIEVEGNPQTLTDFLEKMNNEAPPLAEIIEIEVEKIPTVGEDRFEILRSQGNSDNRTLISPDTSICDDCLRELFDKSNQRYLYPFINCTNCGPRFTIIKRIPYDRPFTTMQPFKMCAACQNEYDDPKDRRFHAQPNACTQCGPHVFFESLSGEKIVEDDSAIEKAIEMLITGKIVTIKGLGGFHLAVDARNNDAVIRLRNRKNREAKPLAIMVETMDDARKVAHINREESLLLTGKERPIVLLRRKEGSEIAEAAAPDNRRLGVMLPYTPLHYLLFYYLRKHKSNNELLALVMTSANRSEEPIVIDNDDARRRLQNITDGFLFHDREILIRADDSVLFFSGSHVSFMRRSRGYVPRPIFVKPAKISVLAVGAELKNTICYLKNENAFLSQHIGDLQNLLAHDFFKSTITHFKNILDVEVDAIVCDRHPDYFSARWAREQRLPLIEVQHHHAHLASVMAEWKLDRPVIGIVLDGTGYGYDNTIWGGEVLIGDMLTVRRSAHLEALPLPGGDSAVKEPWKIAISYLYHTFGDMLPELKIFDDHPSDMIIEMVRKKINSPLTSSCGRLFDAAAAMSGGRQAIRYEGQAAIEMMQAVKEVEVKSYNFDSSLSEISIKPIIRNIVKDVINGVSLEIIAARFHKTIIELFADIALENSKKEGLKDVVLSGGVFQNEIILSGMMNALQNRGLNPYCNKLVPANDGGISLGQAVIGRALLQKGKDAVEYFG
jgi:hydrogenase maturation protein HypF